MFFSLGLSACKEQQHTHTFVDYVCSECGYDKLSDVSWLPQTDYKNVGEKFNTVVKPLYDAANTILMDLIENGNVGVNEYRNTRIVGIRYVYGFSFQIIIREDTFVDENGKKSEFLQYEGSFSLENFGDRESYTAFENFLLAERKSQSNEDYEELVLPYAERSAELILARYQIFKNSEDKEINWYNHGKQLIISADSSLSEIYDKIVCNLNGALAKIGYPLITNQDLNISFSGQTTDFENMRIEYNQIIVNTYISCVYYDFYLVFNQNGEFTQDYLNHMRGQDNPAMGGDDSLNPQNEEFAELFERLKIEEIDLSDLKDFSNYNDGVNQLSKPTPYSYESTLLYF